MTTNEMVHGNGAGATTREGFGTREMTRTGETTATALATQARASIEAAYIMAANRPRDLDTVRVRLLADCKRPGFAKVARYAKPVGGQRIEGPSIRFVESALRLMGNVASDATTIYEDADKLLVRVEVLDLETNTAYRTTLNIGKTVERSKVRDGQEVVGQRQNTSGRIVYIVRATEDDLANKIAAAVSKATRTLGLRVIPGDLVEEGQEQCIVTMESDAASDPAAARKKIADAFASIGVMPDALAQYLGHELSSCSPAETVDLRTVFAAIRDGETSWSVIMESRRAARGEDSGGQQGTGGKVAGLRAKVAPKAPTREPGDDGDEPPPAKAAKPEAPPVDVDGAHEESTGGDGPVNGEFASDEEFAAHLAGLENEFAVRESWRKRQGEYVGQEHTARLAIVSDELIRRGVQNVAGFLRAKAA